MSAKLFFDDFTRFVFHSGFFCVSEVVHSGLFRLNFRFISVTNDVFTTFFFLWQFFCVSLLALIHTYQRLCFV